MAVEPTVLSEPDPEEADSLVSSNDPDDMQNEQTWPTEEEMQDDPSREPAEGTQLPDAAPGTTPRVVRRVPKGTSEYQAAWIIEEDDKEDAGIGEGDEGAQNGNAEELVEVPVPDKVDTPKVAPARIRFQRYRGLRSFRTSPWDPYENLPRDYARIFQFEDFKRTERAIRRRAEEEG